MKFNDRYINTDEAASYLAIKKSWLYQNHKVAKIPSYRVGRKLVFRVEELDSWLASRRSD